MVLLGIPLYLLGHINLITLIIVSGIIIICSLLFWYHTKFHIVEFIFDKQENTMLKVSVDLRITRHFFCKLSDIDVIECRKGSFGFSSGSPNTIGIRMKQGKKINFYNCRNKDEALDMSDELKTFLDVPTIFPYDDSLVPWKDSTGREIYENLTGGVLLLGVVGWFLLLIGGIALEINLWALCSNPASFFQIVPVQFLFVGIGSFYSGPIFIYAFIICSILCIIGFLALRETKKTIKPGKETPKFLYHYEFKTLLLTCFWVLSIVAIIIGSIGIIMFDIKYYTLEYLITAAIFLGFGISSLSISLIYYLILLIRSKIYWKKHGYM